MYDRGEGLEDTWMEEVVGGAAQIGDPGEIGKTCALICVCACVCVCLPVCGSTQIADGDSLLSGVA